MEESKSDMQKYCIETVQLVTVSYDLDKEQEEKVGLYLLILVN